VKQHVQHYNITLRYNIARLRGAAKQASRASKQACGPAAARALTGPDRETEARLGCAFPGRRQRWAGAAWRRGAPSSGARGGRGRCAARRGASGGGRGGAGGAEGEGAEWEEGVLGPRGGEEPEGGEEVDVWSGVPTLCLSRCGPGLCPLAAPRRRPRCAGGLGKGVLSAGCCSRRGQEMCYDAPLVYQRRGAGAAAGGRASLKAAL